MMATKKTTLAAARELPARQTAHEFVRETLRLAILRGELSGGSRLVQADIAEELRVSITPVREALRDLATEGVIRLDPHRGAVVGELTLGELDEIMRLRRILEIDVMRLAAELISPEQIAAARTIHEAMLVAPDPATWATLNREFHLSIYRAAEKKRQFEMVRSLIDSSMLYVNRAQRQPASRKRANEDHGALLDLLAVRDIDGVQERLREHIMIPLRTIRSEAL